MGVSRARLSPALVLVSIVLVPVCMALRARPSLGMPADALPPALPSSFSGTVTVNGMSVPEGTLITVGGGAVVYAQTVAFLYGGASVYRIDAPGDNPDTQEREGGLQGEELQFTIGELVAGQTACWQSGSSQTMGLTATGEQTPTNTPAPTDTPAPTPSSTPTLTLTNTPAPEAPPEWSVHVPLITR